MNAQCVLIFRVRLPPLVGRNILRESGLLFKGVNGYLAIGLILELFIPVASVPRFLLKLFLCIAADGAADAAADAVGGCAIGFLEAWLYMLIFCSKPFIRCSPSLKSFSN